jgi:CheY-like chemotaxis protein
MITADLVGSHAEILLAEDDRELRRFLAQVLQRDGYRVTEVDSGHDLLDRVWDRAAGKAGFDLIISDVQMSGFTGLEVLEVLRAERDPEDDDDPHTQGTPIILITAFGDLQLHRDARRLGAVVFDKPFDIDELRAFAVKLVRPLDAAGPGHQE